MADQDAVSLEALVRWLRECLECGEPHPFRWKCTNKVHDGDERGATYHPRGTPSCGGGTWASVVDGHGYQSREAMNRNWKPSDLIAEFFTASRPTGEAKTNE